MASKRAKAKRGPHDTVPMLVWADIDKGIAAMVKDLNSIKGVRTHTSCEGGITYRGFVQASWTLKALQTILTRYEVLLPDKSNGYWGTIFAPRRDGDKRI